MPDDFAFMDAMALAEGIRKRDIDPLELLEWTISRIETLNPILNAVVTPMYDQARAALSTGLPDGPLAGVPYLLKDILGSYAGVRLTSGCRALENNIPDHDSELVRRLKKAGLVVVGRTNAPELGILPTTEPQFYGPCKNPWDLGRTTGGSSGGSAAAVAAGMVPAAHANDGGGSIRIPASCCGLFGLKPTRGRNPLGPDFGDIMGGFIAEHAVTRTVRDSAVLLDATAGPDIGDPYWAPPPAGPFLKEVETPPGKLRIAFTTEAFNNGPVHADCKQAVLHAAKYCEDLGHDVFEGSPSTAGAEQMLTDMFMIVWSAGTAWTVEGISMLRGEAPDPALYEPLTWALYEMGAKHTATQYQTALLVLQRIARQLAAFFTDVDIWLTPTLAEPPVPLGSFDATPENPLAGMQRAEQFVPFTPVCNITGQPAMSVPLHWNDEGLPVGTQFIGRFGDEATLFRLAGQLEKARPWSDRKPNLNG
jgi:amidase